MSGSTRNSSGSAEAHDVVKHRENVLQLFPWYYAFVSRREGPGEGPWHVVATCMPKKWMDRVWVELQRFDSLGEQLAKALGGDSFDDAYARIRDVEPALQVAHDAWSWFVDRSGDEGDPMESSGVELHVPATWNDIELGEWYLVELSDAIDDPAAPERPYSEAPQCFHTVFKIGHPDAEETVLRQTLAYERVPDLNGDKITQGILKALHFPHHNPRGKSDGSGGGSQTDPVPSGPAVDVSDGQAGGIETPGHPTPKPIDVRRVAVIKALGGYARSLRAKLKAWHAHGSDFVRDVLVASAGLLLTPAFAPAGQPQHRRGDGPALPAGRPEHAPGHSLTHAFYVGSPALQPHPPQIANPLIQGPHPAFVAVLDVGQGNCNAIYDNNGHILAYYDIGHPWGHMVSSRPALRPPPAPFTQLTPCVCDRPLIILSHFDLDHFKLGLDTAATHNLTWLAPQQAYGTEGTALFNAVRDAGGQVHVWTAQGGHMRFPWGFMECCTAPVGNLNGSGLAAFVCVRDDPVIARLQQTISLLAGQLAGALQNGAPANIEVLARPVAAALAAIQAALAPADVARAAVRATVSASLGNLDATPAAVAAFITRIDGPAEALTDALTQVNANLVGNLPAVVPALPLGPATLHDIAQAAIATANAAPGVPAGNHARAAAAAAPFGGNAANVGLVCHPAVSGAGGADINVDQSATSARSRSSVAAVQAIVDALPAQPPPPAHTVEFSRTVAACFGASAAATGVASAQVSATAAVRTVVALLATGGLYSDADVAHFVVNPTVVAAAPVRQAINANHGHLVAALPTLAANHGILPPNFGYLSSAARAAIGAGQGDIPAQIAAYKGVNVFTNTTAARAALAPQVSVGVLPGQAPHARGERFVHLNADGNFDYIPSFQVDEPPVVVAMTAMHHGSALEDGDFIASERIPWAPGSVAAGNPAVAVTANQHVSAAHCIAETAHQLQHNAAAPAALRQQVAHAGSAAAAAVLAVNATRFRPRNVIRQLTDHHLEYAQGVAAAVQSSLIGPTEAGEVAVAATLGFRHRAGLGPAHDFAYAAKIAVTQLRLNAPIATIEASVGAAYPNLSVSKVTAVTSALGPAMAPTQPFIHYSNDLTSIALAIEIGAYQRQVANLLTGYSWLAATAQTGVGVETGAIIANINVAAGTLAADVSAIMALEIGVAPNNPVDANEAARRAAVSAMVAEAIRQTGVTAGDLIWALVAIEHGTTTTAAAATADAIGGGPGPIAYSYGVKAGGVHCYSAESIGGLGHPHPIAIADYQAHGWTVRRNAAGNANHAGSQSDNSPAGHVALAWDYTNDRILQHPYGPPPPPPPVVAQVIADPANTNPNGLIDVPPCGTCGQHIRLNL